jgi:hypothetical protein
MSERNQKRERPSPADELPEDLDPRPAAKEVRGGSTPLQSNVQKTIEDTKKAAINNLRP